MRILAGEYKRRTLLSPPDSACTRPITGLAKKSLMDSLSGWWPGATVLDLYCGTGTLGLEALSRGAAKCYFAEYDRDVLDCLRQNIETLGTGSRSIVWTGDVTTRLARWLPDVDSPVDVAFVDPPYAQSRAWDWDAIRTAVFDPLAAVLAPNGLVVLRVPGTVAIPCPLAGLVLRREKHYGDMHVAVLSADRE